MYKVVGDKWKMILSIKEQGFTRMHAYARTHKYTCTSHTFRSVKKEKKYSDLTSLDVGIKKTNVNYT